MKFLIAALALVLTVSSSRALDVVFTFTGIAMAGEPGQTLGYNEGEAVTFQLVMDGSALGLEEEHAIDWLQLDPADPILWKSITGTGLTGSYTEPTEPYSYVFANDSGLFSFQAAASDPDDNIGLMSPDGVLIQCVCGDVITETVFGAPAGNLTAEQYFANYLGPVTFEPGSYFSMEGVGLDGMMVDFELTSFTISMVPEPTTGVLMGLGLAGLFLRRRRS